MNNQPTQLNNLKARNAALQVFRNQTVVPTSLVKYQSRGKLLIIGDQSALDFVKRLDGKLDCTILLTAGKGSQQDNVIHQEERDIEINGHLGAFSIELKPSEKKSQGMHLNSDLILDLGDKPVLDRILLPNGYFHTDSDPQSLNQVAEQLADMIGTFEKPVFIDYDSAICAHSRSGKEACRKCIDACPAAAISSIVEMVEVDTFLCQGGGVCATVCPSGAMTYVYPKVEDLLKNARVLIRTYSEQGGREPIIAFFADADGGEIDNPEQDNILPIMIEELASVGLEVWLSLLAYGAASILIVNRGNTAVEMLQELQQQIQVSSEILRALGYPANSVALVSQQELGETLPALMPEIPQASYAAIGGKRQTAYFAIDHLYEQAERPRKMALFSIPTMFGTAFVEDNCTLCHSCVEACPGKALQTGDGIPQLKFIEANCVQCGMCTRICPENAISITPRLLFEREQRQQTRLLYEESPFNCISCGKPFATRSVIENMLAKLSDHWMFKTERAKNRLKMCEDCRVVDVVQDEAAMDPEKEQSLH